MERKAERFPWDSEVALVDSYADALPDLWGHARQTPFVLREVRVGYGRPDVVVVYASPRVLDARAGQRQTFSPLSRLAADDVGPGGDDCGPKGAGTVTRYSLSDVGTFIISTTHMQRFV